MMMPNVIMKPFLVISLLTGFSACKAAEPQNSYKFPDHLFSNEIHEGKSALPMNFLETLNHHPKNECEREDLRQLFIIADWQMNDFFSQSYYLDAKSEGIGVLLKAFPELLDKPLLAERDNLVYSYTLRQRLIDIKTDCKR